MSVPPPLFDPSGSLLAYVTPHLSSHLVSVAALSSAPSSLVLLEKNTYCTSLGWARAEQSSDSSQTADKLLIIGTSDGRALLFLPAANSVIESLAHGLHNYSLRSVHYCSENHSLYAISGRNEILEWSLATMRFSKAFPAPVDGEDFLVVSTVRVQEKVLLLVASHRAHVIDSVSGDLVQSLSGHASPIRSIGVSGTVVVTCAENDRFCNVYDALKSFAQSAVLSAKAPISSVYAATSLALVVTENGAIEVFYGPSEKKVVDVKRRRRSQGVSRPLDAVILLKRPEKTPVPVQSVTLAGPRLVYTWFENATAPVFDSVACFQGDQPALSGKNEFVKLKIVPKDVEHSSYTHDVAATGLYNESNAFLTSGDNFRDLDAVERGRSDVEMDLDDGNDTLGEKLLASNPKAARKSRKSTAPATGSLSTVLSQALRSSDQQLLDTVLRTKDEKTIRNTVENIDSLLALGLLDRLSEKYNFASSYSASVISQQKQIQLDTWIKWVLVVHGSTLKLGVDAVDLARNLSTLAANLGRKSGQLPKLVLLESKVNSVFERINYKGEVLNDFGRVKRPGKWEENGVVRYESDSEESVQDYVEEEEDII